MLQQEFDTLVPSAGDMTRRRFVHGTVGAGFAAAVLPVAAQAVVKTSAYRKIAKLVAEVIAKVPDAQVMAALNGPVLSLYGGADTGISLHSVEKMRAALAAGNAAARRSEIVVYPEAPHAFHADYRPSYRKDAAEDGWRRCLAWFKANGLG